MAIIAAPDGSYYSNKTGKTYTREEVLAKLAEKKEQDNGSLFGSVFSGNTTQYEQTGALENAIQGNGRGVDVGDVEKSYNAHSYVETDTDRAARLREASNILGLDEVEGASLMRGGLSDNDVMKSALALAKKKQNEPDDWEQFATEHPATVKYLEQQKNMAISYDDVKPLGRLEDTANQVKTHLEMIELEEKIAELGRKYDSQNMSYNELSADQRVELNDLLTRRKELQGNIDTWSVGNVLGGLASMKEDLPMAIGMGIQMALVGAGVGAAGAGVGALPGAMTGFGAGFKIGLGASMGYRMAGTQYAENMMRADANGQYMDANSLRQGAWAAGTGMALIGAVGTGRLTSKLPGMGQFYDKFIRTTSPSVLNNPEARQTAWNSFIAGAGVGLKEAAIQDVLFGGGTAALTFGANRYSEALSGLDYSNREDGTLIDNIINGMMQFAPMALGTGVGFSVGGRMMSNALSSKGVTMPVADGLNRTMDAVNDTRTAQRSPQATRDAVNTIFGENASAQDVEIDARGLVRLCQEADPENPNLAAEVAQKLGVDAETLNKAVETEDTIRVSVTDFVTEMKDSELRQEVLKEVKDIDGLTENGRQEILTYQKQAFNDFAEELKAAVKGDYDTSDPAYIAAMEHVKTAYPKLKTKDTEDMTKLIYAGFKRMEERGILKLNGFETAEQAIRAITVQRKNAPDTQGKRLNQFAGENAENAPMDTLTRAKMMEGSPEEIYRDTGWIKGEDGKWRFEIPDNLEAIDFSKVDEYGDGTLGTIYDNPQLFEAYPNLRYVPVSVKDNMGQVHGRAILNKLTGQSRIEISVDLPDVEKATTLVHEVQHLIQKEENFAAGGSDSTVRERLLDRVEQLNEKIEAEKDQDKIKSLTTERDKIKKALDKYNDYRLYRMLGGEEEARTTEYLAKERADTFAEAKEAEEKYESLKAKASPEQREMLAEYEKLYFLADMSDEEESRFIELANKIDDDLTQAFAANDWYKDTVAEMEQGGGHRYMPKPHDSYALIVFDGVEHEARQAGERAANDVINDTMQELFQRAWHGTPHDFEKFDLGAIGSGEGQQMHGWGLYFAQDRKVSETRYRERLAGKAPEVMADDLKIGDKTFSELLDEVIDEGDYNKQSALENFEAGDFRNKDKVIKMLKSEDYNATDEEIAWFTNIADEVEKQLPERPGKLFEVEIPDSDVLLDEQKPFSEQPEKVQKSLEEMKQEYGMGYEDDEIYIYKEDGEEVARYKIDQEEEASDFVERHNEKVEELRAALRDDEATGREIYERISAVYGGDKQASEALNRAGVKGITYTGGIDGRCFVVFDDKAVEIINKYNQEANKKGETLASMFPNAKYDESGEKMVEATGHAIIQLYQHANPSSLAHEMLHHWVTLHENAFKTGMMEGQVLEDYQKLADFAGHKLGEEWSTEEHEKLASAWETYLSEGKAPSLELVGTFTRFKQWMKRIYQSLTRHAIPINDEVRGVFDRMLASDRELEMAQAFYESEPIFAGREMNESALREYAGIVMAAHQEAQKEMDRRVMAEVNPAMKEIRDNVAANLREDIAAKMMYEPVYAARALFTAPLDTADFKAAKADAIKAKIDERVDLLVKQSALGVEKKGMIAENAKQVSQEWFGGFSNNYDWYKEMFARKGGKIPASWYRFIKAYKAGEKTLKQMPKTMREEYEYIANEQLTHGHRESMLGDIPEDIEFVNLKEDNPAMSWIVANGGGIRLDRQSVYERFGKGALPERWLTDKGGFTIDEVADYVYGGKGSGDLLFQELTTKPTFAKELANRVRVGMAEFKEQEYGTLRESAIKAVHNEKSLEALAVDLEMFEQFAAEKKAKEQQKTADAMAEGRERSKWENKVEAEKQKGQEALAEQRLADEMHYGGKLAEQKRESAEKLADAKAQGREAVADQKLADSIYYGGKMAEQKRKADEKLDAAKNKLEEQKLADEMHYGRKMEEAKRKSAEAAARDQRRLDAAVMRGKLRAKMARDMAKEQLANTKVGEVLNWSKYAALGKKAGDEAIRMLSKGDYEGAIEAKNREIMCRALAREAGKMDTEINRTMRYFDRINRRGNKMNGVPHEFNVQIDKILANYGLLSREPLKPLEGDKSLQTFINDCQEDYFTPQVADFLINGQPQHYTRLTVSELRDLKSSVESIRHVGRQMDALVANEKKQRISDIAASMVEQLSTHEKKYALEGEMGAYDKTPLSVTSLVKAETLLRLMDKGEENGVFVRNIYNPIKLGLDDMSNRSRKIIADVDKLLADTGWTKAELTKLKDQEHTFDFMPNPKITHEQVLHAALNWGNEGNRDRLRYYFMSPAERKKATWTEQELAELDGKVMQMFEVLTEKDLKLVQGVWDYLETYAPEIRKHEIDCAGVDPKMVEATPFSVMTADGKVVNLKGGYYPIRYDSGKSVRAMDLQEANELFKKNSAVAASVEHGHVKSRVSHMNRPLLLDWSTFTDHLRNVNYDLAMRKPIMDVSRLLRRDDVQTAIAETFGNDNLRMLQTWVRDVATDQREALTFTEKAMKWTRTRMSVAFLGFRTKALFIDLPQNFITSAWQHGADEVIKGTAQFYLSGDYREKIAFVNQRSPMMRDKTAFMDANLADLRVDLMDGSRMAQLTRISQKVAFCCDMFSDAAVNYPMWLRFHERALARGLSDAEASLEADAKVRRQSVDTTKAGMAAVQRGGEGRKLLTPFYSYFSAFFNRLYYDYNLAQIKWADGQQMDAAGLMVRTAVLGVGVPTMLEAIMQGIVLNNDKTKDKKKREENMYKEMASSSFSYLANTIPVGGAMATFAFNKAIGKKFTNYELSPIEGAVENLLSVPAATVNYVNSKPEDKDAGKKLAESVAKAAAIGAPYPNMLNTLAFNIWDLMTQSGDFTLADIVTRRRNQK